MTHTHPTLPDRQNSARPVWAALLIIASTLISYVFVCATPFPALAAVAALTLRQRDGMVMIIASLIAAQIMTYPVQGHDFTMNSVAWTLGLGMAAVFAAWAAYRTTALLQTRSIWLQAGAAYLAAFIGFKAIVAVWSLGLGGLGAAFDPDIMWRQFTRYGTTFVGLMILHSALTALGMPGIRRILTAR